MYYKSTICKAFSVKVIITISVDVLTCSGSLCADFEVGPVDAVAHDLLDV